MTRNVLPVTSVDDGELVDELVLRPDGQVEGGATARGILRTIMREQDLDVRAAVALLDAEGWSNGHLVIEAA